MAKKQVARHLDAFRSPFEGWLFFLYKVPSKPVNNRMKIWRRLTKVGAVQFKGAAYLLPANEDHLEFFNWLAGEVSDLDGEVALIKADRVENIDDAEIMELFNIQRATEYEDSEKSLQDLERQFRAIQKGSDLQVLENVKVSFHRAIRNFEVVSARDFFSSPVGQKLQSRVEALSKKYEKLSFDNTSKKDRPVSLKSIQDYQGKTWVTRTRPFVDRMASAWLIQRYIDKKATFSFLKNDDLKQIKKSTITFDIKNADFTHVGDLCTFEILLRSFSLSGKSLKKISQIVHNLDIKDDKYSHEEERGLEEILLGIRKADLDDQTTLKKGMDVFEMLYSAFD